MHCNLIFLANLSHGFRRLKIYSWTTFKMYFCIMTAPTKPHTGLEWFDFWMNYSCTFLLAQDYP